MATQSGIGQQFIDYMNQVAPPKPRDHSNEGITRRNSMIAMRLRLPENAALPFDFIATHETPDKVLVFIANGGKPLVLEDDPHLFPSDQMITQLRLIMSNDSRNNAPIMSGGEAGQMAAQSAKINDPGLVHAFVRRK